MGAAYGTSKAGVGILVSGISRPELVWRNLIPIIMAGVNGIYGLITAIIVLGSIITPDGSGTSRYSLYTAFAHLASGFCCGLTGLASGLAIGAAGDASVRACGYSASESRKQVSKNRDDNIFGGGHAPMRKKKQSGGGDQLFVSMVLIQVFAGNLGLYGLIMSLILSQSQYICD
jgi:V-type H+-transporting ATPase 16kDa proteolipid subunit